MKPEELAELERLAGAASDAPTRHERAMGETALHRAVRKHLPALLAAAREAVALRVLVEEAAQEECESAREDGDRRFDPPHWTCPKFLEQAHWCLPCRARAALNPPTD